MSFAPVNLSASHSSSGNTLDGLDYLQQLSDLQESILVELEPGRDVSAPFFDAWQPLTDRLILTLNKIIALQPALNNRDLLVRTIDEIIIWCDVWAAEIFPKKYPGPAPGLVAKGVLILERIAHLCRDVLVRYELKERSQTEHLALTLTQDARLPFSYMKNGVCFVAERIHDASKNILQADGWSMAKSPTGSEIEIAVPTHVLITEKLIRSTKHLKAESAAMLKLESLGVVIGPLLLAIEPIPVPADSSMRFVERWHDRVVFNFRQLKKLDFCLLPKLRDRLQALLAVCLYLRLAAEWGFSWKASLASLVCYNHNEQLAFGLGAGRKFFNDSKSFQRSYNTVARFVRQLLCAERSPTVSQNIEWPNASLISKVQELTHLKVVDETGAMDAFSDLLQFLRVSCDAEVPQITLPSITEGWLLPFNNKRSVGIDCTQDRYQDWLTCCQSSEYLKKCEQEPLKGFDGDLSFLKHALSLQQSRNILCVGGQELFVIWQTICSKTDRGILLGSHVESPQMLIIKIIRNDKDNFSLLSFQATNSVLHSAGCPRTVFGIYQGERAQIFIMPFMGRSLHHLSRSYPDLVKELSANITLQVARTVAVLGHEGVIQGDSSLGNWVVQESNRGHLDADFRVMPIDYDRNFLLAAFNLPKNLTVSFPRDLICMSEEVRYGAHSGTPPFYSSSVIILGDYTLGSREANYSIGVISAALLSIHCFASVWEEGMRFKNLESQHADRTLTGCWQLYLGKRSEHEAKLEKKMTAVKSSDEAPHKRTVAALALECLEERSSRRPSIYDIIARLSS